MMTDDPNRYSVGSVLRLFYALPSFPLFCAYLLLTLTWGFWGRKVPKIQIPKQFLFTHNLLCVFLSGVSCYLFTVHLLHDADGIYSKQPSDKLRTAFFLYWCSKIFELLDTVFMLVKRNRRQISFLHVYHHSSMLLLSDCAYRRFPWPCMAFGEALNSFVHIFVYGYYMASSHTTVGMFWKRVITQIQIVQFFLGVLYVVPGVIYHNFCYYSLAYDLSMLLLFTNFYLRAYHWKRVTVKGQQNGEPANYERQHNIGDIGATVSPSVAPSEKKTD